MNFPMVAISSILMDNGNFLFWDGWQQPEPTEVWNPASPSNFTTLNAPDSVFCDGAAQLPDGRIIVIGGYGGLSTRARSASSTPTSSIRPPTPGHGWPTCTCLAGTRLSPSWPTGGTSRSAATPPTAPPGRTPQRSTTRRRNTWTLLSKVCTSQVHEEEYPFSYLIPNGNIFTIGPSEDVIVPARTSKPDLDPGGWPERRRQRLFGQYLPGKILYSGGAASRDKQPACAEHHGGPSTHRGQSGLATDRADGCMPRVYHTLMMLADGQVLAVGGGTISDQTSDHDRRAADRDLGPGDARRGPRRRRSRRPATTTPPPC